MKSEEQIRWLHISDFHFKAGEVFDRDVVLKAFLKSLDSLLSRFGQPDLVFATGDIAQTGSVAEYEPATKFFDALLERLSLNRDRLFIVPGNHDVDRRRGKGLVRTLLSNKECDNYFDPKESLPHIIERQAAFESWYNDYFEGIRSFCNNSSVIGRHIIKIRNFDLGVTLINSAIFSYDDSDNGQLLVGRRCLSNLTAEMQNEIKSIEFALMHHPLSWLSTIESSNVKTSTRELFDVVLSGHLHEVDAEQVIGVSGEALHLMAGALYQTREWPNTAMFATFDGEGVEVKPIRYRDSPREVWTVDTALFPDAENFTRKYTLAKSPARGVISESGETIPDSGTPPPAAVEGVDDQLPAATTFESDLFTSPRDRPLYIEPTLMPRAQDSASGKEAADRVTIEALVRSTNSYFIEAKPEYGGSSLCKRLELELNRKSDLRVYREDARKLPNYRKKLEGVFPAEIGLKEPRAILILDDFDAEKHERLLHELTATGWFKRMIVISIDRGSRPARILDIASLPFEFRHLFLWPISRSDVRTLAQTLFETESGAFISDIVDKVYSDLLALCIPLTPSNVIMYLRILYREGEYHPLNRVDILGRYLTEALRKPSDVYSDSFNAKNKLDVLANIVYILYCEEKSLFSERDWHDIVSKYQADTLIEFNSSEFLNELVYSRILSDFGGKYSLKYSFFFSYFLGRHLAGRPNCLKQFLDDQGYLQLRGVIDVITGLSTDNTAVLSNLCDRIEGFLSEFSRQYLATDFDPLLEFKWPDSELEDEEVWAPIAKQIEAGPKSASEIDVIKSSIIAEARTNDQNIVYTKFTELENALFATATVLADALRNADDVGGALKMRALEALLQVHLVSFQVGVVFAEIIGRSPIFRWGGVAFIDFHKVEREPGEEGLFSVVDAINFTVAQGAAEILGTKKLGPVFKSFERHFPETSYKALLNFNCILKSRPIEWEKILSKSIDRTDKNAFYLGTMLGLIMCMLENEIITAVDRDRMKRLVAQIRAKRDLGKQLPGSKAISRVLSQLEENEYFKNTAKPPE